MLYERLNVLRRPLAVILGLMATYALVHFVFNSLYDENSLMLDILGYITAVGVTFFVVLTYITGVVRKSRISAQPALSTRR